MIRYRPVVCFQRPPRFLLAVGLLSVSAPLDDIVRLRFLEIVRVGRVVAVVVFWCYDRVGTSSGSVGWRCTVHCMVLLSIRFTSSFRHVSVFLSSAFLSSKKVTGYLDSVELGRRVSWLICSAVR